MQNHIATDPKLDNLKWRCIGPSRGGRVVAVAGDPSDPMVFYFGGCAGGIWKTTDGGTYWECVSDHYLNSATIGALAVSESDPNVIYAGTGETTIRIDVSFGDGMYKSTDAGRTWTHIGLKEVKHIGEVRIHPDNPDHVYVAAFGDAFGPTEERGVYRSLNGGETWEKVLYQDEQTGAIDISLDPKNPRIMFASFWQAYRKLWTIESGGPGSALFRSKDGGDTWEEVSGKAGFAKGMLGKIGVSVSPVQSGRVFALVEGEGDEAGLYRSDDYGDTWKMVSPNRDLLHRPWYYTHVFADTGHADTVYVTNLQMWKSTDGGVSFSEITTPHGDNHDLWIDPNNPKRMVQGNDGGANVSFNGGYTWSTIYNQKTAQFYRMDIDNEYPYNVYSTQQDNTSIAVPSATEWGMITPGDCWLPGTGESGFIAVHPDDSNIVYVGAVGSSPGGTGALQRYDHRTRQIKLINVWPEEGKGYAPRDLKYRFAWTFPIVFSPHDSGTLYAGGNHVFRTKNEGMSWEEISPDLSRNDRDKQGLSGGPLTGDSAGAEVYATCASVVESIHRPGEIWASTDDGLVHVTRDDGGSWTEVTPPDMPMLAYVGNVEVSAHDADTVYLSATCYKNADYEPYLFRTKDGGKTWHSINGNFPEGEITRVIRADAVRPGLLYVGTETGIFFSLDDGATWSRMGGGFPVVPVYDLKLKNEDLVAATHGRSFWILDDVTPLRAMANGGTSDQLFAPRTTVRTKLTWSVGLFSGDGIGYGPAFGVSGASYVTEEPNGRMTKHYLDTGENPPNGAIIYYWLAEDAKGPITITVRDQDGNEVVSYNSDDEDAPFDKKPGTAAGLNRFIWDLKHKGAVRQDPKLRVRKYEPLAKERGVGPAATAMPGSYQVALSVGGKEQVQSFDVVKDPRLDTSEADYTEQFELMSDLVAKMSELNSSVNAIRLMKRQIGELQHKLGDGHGDISDLATGITDGLTEIEGKFVNIHKMSPRDVLRHAAGLDEAIGELMAVASIADAKPPQQAHGVAEEVFAKIDDQVGKLNGLVSGDIADLNKQIVAAEIDAVGISSDPT